MNRPAVPKAANTLLCHALFIASTGIAASAQQTDVIRGRVTADTVPLPGVNVKATSYMGSVTRTTTTDRNGRYTLLFANGEGDYWLDFTRLGFSPKRFEIKRIGDEEILIADARMTSAMATLDAEKVIAQRDRALPNRSAAGSDVGGGERALATNGGPPDQAGNLAAMAATLAGVQLIPGLDGNADMYSLLGLTGDQNSTTFNGLGSGVTALPPDILATTSIVPFTFDPARGGFSGAQIAIQTIPGSNFSRRSASNVDITPPLEWADDAAAAQSQEYTNIRLGGNAAGPIVMNNSFYNAAYNIGNRFQNLETLLNASAAGLASAGVSPDSITRLLSILSTQHVPTTVAAAPGLQTQDVAQGSLNVDWTPSASGTGHAFTLGAVGNYQRTRPVSRGSLLLSTPAHGGQTDFWGANLSLAHSNYFWFGVLSKTAFGFAASGSASDPYLRLPEGNVRVNSDLPDGSSSVKSVFFGGNSTLSSLDNRTVQLTNQLSWFSEDNHHTLKVTSGVTGDAFTADASPSLLGAFSFNSLADLQVGAASSFTRTLSRTTHAGSQVSESASVGDYWRPSANLQVQYGVRLDANQFLSAPSLNPLVLSTFGVRNDELPNHAYVSPRVGVQWYYGSAPQVSYAPGAARPPRAVLHAGAGVFQNMAPSQLVSTAVSSTGLANSTRTITCVGDAVPFPEWDAFLTDPSTIPTQCAGGSAGTVFSTSAPSVSLFGPGYRQQQSLRAAADWSSPILDNRFVLGLQAIVSSGTDQPGVIDINFNPTTHFTLRSEAGRPVFADPSAIVANTGAISTVATRVSPSFQRVLLQQSNLEVRSKQLVVNLKPVTANAYLKWDLTYTFLGVRESFNGFTTTVGNPFETTWGPHLTGGRHTVTLGWRSVPVFDIVYLTSLVQFTSGQQYTPMIAGDVNGDGYPNDRAFIFDPAKAVDPPISSAMQSLLASATPAARDCLEAQLNTLAARGSCQAPWTANAGLLIAFNPQKIGLPKRATVTFNIQNPLGLADLALHGSDNIHGWGLNIPPDQNLLFVRGFDPSARQFKYDVNQRFGSTRPQQALAHALPFISLSVSIDVGATRERQMLSQRLDIGRKHEGTKQGAESMKLLATSSIPNPMDMILQQGDSLRLTRSQADSMAFLSHKYGAYADSMWTPIAKALAALPDTYSQGDAYALYVSARERTVDYLLTIVDDVKHIMTAAQRRKLPVQISNYLDERVLRFLRSSTAGDGTGVVIR